MPRVCTVCDDPRRKSVERMFVAGYSIRRIAARFDVTPSSLRRHVRHVARAMLLAERSKDIQRGRDLLDVAAEALVEARRLLQAAKSGGDLKAWEGAVKALQRHVEVLGKLQRPEQPMVVLLASPDWKRVEDAIFAALKPHTKARNDVARAMMAITMPALPAKDGTYG